MRLNITLLFLFILITGLFNSCQQGDRDLQNFQKFVQRFEENTREISEKNQEMNRILQLVMEHYPDSLKYILSRVDSTLSPEEMDALENLIQSERDASLKGQLKQILSLQQDLHRAYNELEQLRQVLPMPVIVKKGQSHYQLCLDYLVQNHQLEKDEARKLIEKVGLFEPLIEKFYIWNYYNDGVFGSFVTQGEALLSPMQVRRISRDKLQKQIENAQAKRDSAIFISEQLQATKTKLESELDIVNRNLFNAHGRIDSLNREYQQMKANLNSLHYFIDTEESLKNSGFLHSGFLRKTKIRSLPPDDHFSSIDLRFDNTILLIANNYGLEKFSQVTIFPKSFKFDLDYKYSYDPSKNMVSIIFNRPEKFKQQKILIAIN